MKATYLDHLGNDLTVVNAARVSFNKFKDRFDDKDEGLIKYLATHGHWTPFSHPQIQIKIDVPIFVARQDFKHMIGLTRNEVSRRYVDDEPDFFSFEVFRLKPENAKQGSGGGMPDTLNDKWVAKQEKWNRQALEMYREAIADKMAPEQARAFLPQSMVTSYWTTGSLAAWARATKQRMDSHAQEEINVLYQQIDKIIEPLFPVSWKYLIK